MNGSEPTSGDRPRLILPGQDEQQAPPEPEVRGAHDKPGPTAPPGVVSRGLPEWTDPIVDFLKQEISDEALVMDLCLEKAIEIVDWNYQKGLVGNEHFGEGAGGGPAPTRPLVCGIAGPIAIRLYEEVLKSLNGPKKKEFKEVVDKAFEKKAADDTPEGT